MSFISQFIIDNRSCIWYEIIRSLLYFCIKMAVLKSAAVLCLHKKRLLVISELKYVTKRINDAFLLKYIFKME